MPWQATVLRLVDAVNNDDNHDDDDDDDDIDNDNDDDNDDDNHDDDNDGVKMKDFSSSLPQSRVQHSF